MRVSKHFKIRSDLKKIRITVKLNGQIFFDAHNLSSKTSTYGIIIKKKIKKNIKI